MYQITFHYNVRSHVTETMKIYVFKMQRIGCHKAYELRQFRKSNDTDDLAFYLDSKTKFRKLCYQKRCEVTRKRRRELVYSVNNPKQF